MEVFSFFFDFFFTKIIFFQEPTKKIKKTEKKLTKSDRKNKNEQLKEKKAEESKNDLAEQINKLALDEMKKGLLKDLTKNLKQPKIVVFMPFNASADAFKLKLKRKP